MNAAIEYHSRKISPRACSPIQALGILDYMLTLVRLGRLGRTAEVKAEFQAYADRLSNPSLAAYWLEQFEKFIPLDDRGEI